MKPEIIFEDKYLLVVAKPPGWVVPAQGFEESIEQWAEEKLSYTPEKVRLGLPHRLDRLTSGIIVLTKKAQTLKELSAQFEQRLVEKKYIAIVDGIIQPEETRLSHFIRKNNELLKAEVFTTDGPDRKKAELSYRLLMSGEHSSLIDISLHTGRYHQIRAQMSHIGHPVIGDKKYATDSPFYAFYALHAYKLSFTHPKSEERLTFSLLPPDRSFWIPYRDILKNVCC